MFYSFLYKKVLFPPIEHCISVIVCRMEQQYFKNSLNICKNIILRFITQMNKVGQHDLVPCQ